MDINLIYSILFFVTAPLFSIILYKLTSDEKNLIKYYFPSILWLLAITSSIFYSINQKYAFITTYTFITMFVWLQLTKNKIIKNNKK